MIPSDATNEMKVSVSAALDLVKLYRRVLRLLLVLFLVMVGAVLWHNWRGVLAVQKADRQTHLERLAMDLQGSILPAHNAVMQLQSWANEFVHHAPYQGSALIRNAVSHAQADTGATEWSLDTLSEVPARQRLGQMLWLSKAKQLQSGPLHGPSNLALATSILDRFQATIDASSFLRWAYFNAAGQDVLALAPFVTRQELLDHEPDTQTFLKHSWTYEVTTQGLPANNSTRQAYWTKAYLDQAGAGLMVSHGAPVYWGDTFMGVVAVDLQLDFLTAFLEKRQMPGGKLIIANEYGQILAMQSRLADGTLSKPQASASIATLPDALRHGATGQIFEGNNVHTATLSDPKWTLYFLEPQQNFFQNAIANQLDEWVLALILIVAAVLLHVAVWKQLVTPAMTIVEFVASSEAHLNLQTPTLPRLWQPWLVAIERAFTQRQRLFEELNQSRDALEERVIERTAELSFANSRLAELSVTDPLTGAFNRRYLFEQLKAEALRVNRGGESFSLLMMDLDHFKKINDTWGHLAGDAVLQEFVARSQNSVRKNDLVCRFGGEEFLVFMPAIDCDGASVMAERLRQYMDSVPVTVGAIKVAVTVSIGVATFTQRESVEDLMLRVDQLLYRAKELGRNRVVSQTDI